MTIWVDAQLSPRTARWIETHFQVAALPLRDLGLRDAGDEEIFAEARIANSIVLTKDSDFVHLLEQHGSPPKILWLTCGRQHIRSGLAANPFPTSRHCARPSHRRRGSR
jgi:predicted nuclease of predicted toxin-antitoxin system